MFGDDFGAPAAPAPPVAPSAPVAPVAPSAPVAPQAPAPPVQTAIGRVASPEAAPLDMSGPWGQALRSADLGVADGTTDDAGRVAAIRKFGIHELSPDALRALIDRARQLG